MTRLQAKNIIDFQSCSSPSLMLRKYSICYDFLQVISFGPDRSFLRIKKGFLQLRERRLKRSENLTAVIEVNSQHLKSKCWIDQYMLVQHPCHLLGCYGWSNHARIPSVLNQWLNVISHTERKKSFAEISARTILLASALPEKIRLFKIHHNRTLARGRYGEGSSWNTNSVFPKDNTN